MTFYIWDMCCHLTICLHLMEPHWINSLGLVPISPKTRQHLFKRAPVARMTSISRPVIGWSTRWRGILNSDWPGLTFQHLEALWNFNRLLITLFSFKFNFSPYAHSQNAVWILPFNNKSVRFASIYSLQLQQIGKIYSRKFKHQVQGSQS